MITSFFTAGGRLEKVDEVDDGRGDSVVEGVGVDTFESVEYVKTFENSIRQVFYCKGTKLFIFNINLIQNVLIFHESIKCLLSLIG